MLRSAWEWFCRHDLWIPLACSGGIYLGFMAVKFLRWLRLNDETIMVVIVVVAGIVTLILHILIERTLAKGRQGNERKHG